MTSKHWCPNSGTYASFTERVIHDDQHAKCGQCGRLLKLRKNHVIPHHRPSAAVMPPPDRPESEKGETPERLAPGWVRCARCNSPQPILVPSACAGASAIDGTYVCNNGRDCSLRLRRKLRNR